ncbi:MAG: DUF4783 domain-containing protein [Cyclobacteriaceae bacterium]|jgi:hypothetical protein|nr:hypothetical protein [Cytophagales bacterium]
MIRWVTICLLVVASVPVLAQSEIFNPMKDAIKAGDGAALTKTFAPAVDINLEGNINTYSKAQSEFVLKDFFKKHPVADFSIVHTGSSKGGLQFAIGRYTSGGESYNVLIRVRQVGPDYLVHEISFVRE